MARPSVAAERREQIIEATIRTIAEHGVSGASLDRIADAAGMSRGHVRHFVGNRDRLMLDTATVVFSDGNGGLSVLPNSVTTLAEAIDYLFSPEFTTSDSENARVPAVAETPRSPPATPEELTTAYARTTERIDEMIAVAHPGAPEGARAVVAEGMLTAALGNVFLSDFHDDPERTARTRAAVEALLGAL